MTNIIIGLIIFIALAADAYLFYQNNQLNKKVVERVELNAETQQKNQQLDSEYYRLSELCKNEQNKYNDLIEQLDKLTKETYDKAKKDADEQILSYRRQELGNVKLEIENKKEQLEIEYENRANELAANIIILQDKVTSTKDELEDLQSKQMAYINEKLRQEEIENQKDFYKMTLSEESINDIKILRTQVQPLLFNKEVVDKLIWDAFYKAEFDKLSARIFKDNEKHCGIYKITCIPSGKAYVGQSVKYRPVKNFSQQLLRVA